MDNNFGGYLVNFDLILNLQLFCILSQTFIFGV